MRPRVLVTLYSSIRAAVNVLALAVACDPRLTALFTPRHPGAGHYEVCVTAEPLPQLVPDGWTIGPLDPLDAFGSGGPYNRVALLQLYGGHRPQVARGWRERDGRIESETLISPYPNAELTRLEPGTLIIRHSVPR